MTTAKKPRVLIVDDESSNLMLLEGWLRTAGYQVCRATNGQEALTVIPNLAPDIVLLDVMMPDIDGFEVCRRLKSDPRVAAIPVIMLTALTDVEDHVHGIGFP